MKNWLLLLFFFASFANCVFGQTQSSSSYTVKGLLLDSLTQEGEPYATIKIVQKSQPDKAVKMAVTDNKGRFQEKFSTTSGQYTIIITSIGRNPIVRDLVFKPEQTVVDFGTLYSVEATNELGTVEIVAQKPLVKVDIDKIEYNIQDDPDSQTNSILEMLRKVPLVTVDGEDNIKVNGSSSFKIHVNGRPNSMMSNNPKEVLQSMPANTIKHIEVITNPGAKYDAEGIGGILNIVTVGSGFEGYTATFSGRGGNTGGGAGVYATIKKEKLTLTANYNYNLNQGLPSSSEMIRTNLDSDNQPVSEVAYKSRSKNNGNFQHGNLEGSYEIDTLRLITMSVGVYGGSNNSKTDGESWMADVLPAYSSAVPAYDYRYFSSGKNDNGWYSIRGALDYQRMSSKNKDRLLTLSYRINAQPRNSDGYTNYSYTPEEMSPEWENILQIGNQKVDGKQKTVEQTVQADYTTPIGKVNTIEGGVKYILRNNTSEDWRYQQAGADYDLDLNRSSHYKHTNDIFSAYLSYSLRLKKFTGKAGVRYEHTLQHVKFIVGKGENFKSNFNDVVPSFTVGYKLTEMSNLRFSYNMRIWRPGIWYLNPYVNDTDPTNISKGNPDLESEKSHAFNLSYSNFTQKFNVNVSMSYSFNNMGIERISRLVNVGEVVPELGSAPADHQFLFSTYENIGKSKNASIDGYVNWNATPKTRIYTNLSVAYTDLRSPSQDLKNNGFSFWGYGGIQHTFPWELRASLNIFGSTPSVTLQGRGGSFFDYGLNISRSFLKEKRLTASIYANNFFSKYLSNDSYTNGIGFRQDQNFRYQRMRYGASISYRFGQLKASVKKTRRSITNDDVKSGGESTGGGEQ